MTLDPKALKKAQAEAKTAWSNNYVLMGNFCLPLAIETGIAAYLSARAEQGFVEVPRTVTNKMIDAGRTALQLQGVDMYGSDIADAFRAMLSAAQPRETDHDAG